MIREIKTKHIRMINVGLAKQREGDDKVNFDKGIGCSSKSTWSRDTFDITPMQAAILDTLYDAGEGATFSPQRMLNSRTRFAYYAQHELEIHSLPKRGKISCGHDEVISVPEWTLRKVTNFVDSYNYQTEDIEVTRDKDKKDSWLEDYLKVTMETYGIRRSYHAERMLVKSNYTDGNCAWENMANDDGVKCYHHYSHPYETVLGRYTGSGEARKFVYFDEQDQVALLNSVEDKNVLALIKATIPKMKTEARDWLQSTYQKSEYVIDSEGNRKWVTTNHGKRGHYSLTWWHGINRRIKEQGESLYNESMDGTEKNGWVFKATKSYNAGTKGEWVPITPVEHYEIVMVESEWNSKHTGLVYRTKDEALTVVEVLNQSNRVSRKMMDGKSTAEFIVRAEELDIHMSPHFNPDTCTPVDYASMEYDCKLTKELKEQGCNLVHEVTA